MDSSMYSYQQIRTMDYDMDKEDNFKYIFVTFYIRYLQMIYEIYNLTVVFLYGTVFDDDLLCHCMFIFFLYFQIHLRLEMMRGVTIRSGFQRYSISVLPSRSAPTPGLKNETNIFGFQICFAWSRLCKLKRMGGGGGGGGFCFFK